MAQAWAPSLKGEHRNFADEKRRPLLLFDDSILQDYNIESRVNSVFLEAMNQAPSNSQRSITPLFTSTPPSAKISATLPDAPLRKLYKPFAKMSLKPRKLSYAENQQDERNSSDVANGNCATQSPIILWRNLPANRKKKSSGSKDRHTNPTTKTISLEANKENRKRGRPDKKMKQDRNGKNHDNSLSLARGSNSSLTKDLDLNWIKNMQNLQTLRDTGLMIECCHENCKKWRFCNDYHDPTDVPEIWYCNMNSDKTIASCHIPEVQNTEEFEEDLIENAYNAGSLVWAHVAGYPWWPAIVDDCPEILQFYELREPSIVPVKYHVTFFKNKMSHSWVKLKDIKPFSKFSINELVNKTVFRNANYRRPLQEAYIQAKNALDMTILERLKKFSFFSQYLKKLKLETIQDNEHTMNCDKSLHDKSWSSADNTIPGTPLTNTTTKEAYRKIKSMKIG